MALFLALERRPAFAAAVARGILVGLISLAAFCLAYARIAQRASWGAAAAGGTLAYLGLTTFLRSASLSLPAAAAAVILCVSAAYALLPKAEGAVPRAEVGAWDITPSSPAPGRRSSPPPGAGRR